MNKADNSEGFGTGAESSLFLSQRIEILGVSGAGKTTLARSLTNHGGTALLEQHEANPFWGDHKSLKALGYLPYELHFLLQHIALAAKCESSREVMPWICDWSFVTDRLWASQRLGEEIAEYDLVYARISPRIVPALGYIYLKQPVDRLISRVIGRGRPPELKILDRLATSSSALERCVANISPDRVIEAGDSFSEKELAAAIKCWTGTAM